MCNAHKSVTTLAACAELHDLRADVHGVRSMDRCPLQVLGRASHPPSGGSHSREDASVEDLDLCRGAALTWCTSDQASGRYIKFDACDELGAVNLRGTRFASLDVERMTLRSVIKGVNTEVEIRVSGLAGFLLAKCAAAHSRRKPKDWYDIAYVLIHNDHGGPLEAGELVLRRFGSELETMRTSLDDLMSNFETVDAQGPEAYSSQILVDHPDQDEVSLRADAVTAVAQFWDLLQP